MFFARSASSVSSSCCSRSAWRWTSPSSAEPAGSRCSSPPSASSRPSCSVSARCSRSATTSTPPLFVAAALTATSVGITARVFGDLGALSTSEARVVLGAAVADDVMGLIVLTVVVRVVTEGSVSIGSVLLILLGAIAFLVVGGAVALWLAPHLFGGSNASRARPAPWSRSPSPSRSRSPSSPTSPTSPSWSARSSPASRSVGPRQRDRIRRELAPGRAPVHPRVLPRDRHRRRCLERSASSPCCGTPPSSWWWP